MSTVSDQTVNCIGLGVWVLVFKYCPRCLLVEAWQTPLSCCVWIFSFVKLKITIPILQLRINSALLLYFYLCAKTNDVITHLEPDILECKVKWALGSITTNKASGGDGIPGELFQILKDDAVKVLRIWKTQQWPQDWKRSVFIPIPKKSNAKECSNYRTIALILHTSKVMLKII